MPATDSAIDARHAAAMEEVAVADRTDRRRWTVTGRDPEEMLNGIVTNAMPAPLTAAGPGLLRGESRYGLTLSPKGRVVSDHRLMRLGGAEENAFLLDVPMAGAEALSEHFGRYLPPRMARVTDVSEETGMLTVVGPDAPSRMANAIPGWDGTASLLEELEAGEQLVTVSGELEGAEGASEAGGSSASARAFRIVRSTELGLPEFGAPPAFDIIGPKEAVDQIRKRLDEGGCPELDADTMTVLRVEGGAPAFGVDMDESTIPVEAGVHDRAIDYDKGCYTGQEVIVRIRDRGHVNRHLRGLLLEGDEIPEKGTVLHSPELGRDAGEVTTAVRSPAADGVIGFGYVRREVEPGGVVRLGGPDGEPVRVSALEPSSWPPGRS